MQAINIHDAKTQFSRIVDAAIHGRETLIAKAGKPVARIVPYKSPKPKRKFGLLKGKIKISKDFDAPLSESIIEDFEREL